MLNAAPRLLRLVAVCTALLPLLLAPGCATAAESPPPTFESFLTKPVRTVCVSPYTALDTCGTDGTTDFTGYEPELFKKVAQWLYNDGAVGSRPEWAPSKWSFTCFVDSSTGYYDLIAALNNGTCDVAMGGITRDEVKDQPVALTYSTYQSGRRILMYRAPPSPYWVFLQPFSPGVWLLLFGSSVAVALVLLVLETPWLPILHSLEHLHGGYGQRQGQGQGRPWQQLVAHYWSRYSNLQWSVTGLMLHGVFQLSPRSPGGRVVVLGTAFTSLLLACMYTSAYAALITTSNLKAKVTAMSDLTNLPVGIWEGDEESFQVFPLQNLKLLPWNNAVDEERMLQLLRQGVITALVIDAPFADYMTTINCDLYEVGELVLPINMGFGITWALAAAYGIYFDSALQSLQYQNVMQQLQAQYVRIPSTCTDKQAPGSSYTQIMLHDVAGLWVILAACVGAGLLWNLLSWACPRALALLGMGGTSTYRISNPVFMDALQPDWDQGTARSLSQGKRMRNVTEPATIDEALLGVDRRLDKLESFIDQIPAVLSQAMEQRLTALQVELAVVIRHQLIGRGSSNPGREPRDSSGVGGQSMVRDLTSIQR